jgi:hypothetical protein
MMRRVLIGFGINWCSTWKERYLMVIKARRR